jgi:hypothetical protein
MRLVTAGIVIAALCAASMARADTSAPWDWRLRFGWGVTTPKFSDEDKRVSSAKDDPSFPATRFHGAVLGAGLERRLGERTVVTAELTLMIGSASTALAQRFGMSRLVGDRVRLGGGIGAAELVLGSSEEGVGWGVALAPLVFAGVDYDVHRARTATATATIQLELMRMCHPEFGCASWLGEDWVSERGFAWTMVAATASLGVRF